MFAAVQKFFALFAKDEPPLTPYLEGVQAFHSRAPNPYPEGSKEHADWERGYRDQFAYWSW